MYIYTCTYMCMYICICMYIEYICISICIMQYSIVLDMSIYHFNSYLYLDRFKSSSKYDTSYLSTCIISA